MEKKNIFLLFGGTSTEHEISIITAKQTFRALDRSKYNVYAIYLDKNNSFKYISNFQIFNEFKDFKKLNIADLKITINNGSVTYSYGFLSTIAKPDIALLCFHGELGEGGIIQGFLEFLDVPYTGPLLKSAVYGMDKIVMKYIFEKNNIDILPWMYITKKDWEMNVEECLKKIEDFHSYPLIVKPSSLGSSIGVKKVNNKEELTDIINQDVLFDSKIIIEVFGENMTEINCSVMRKGNEILATPTEEVATTNEKFYSYDEKYLKGGKKGGKASSSSEGFATSNRIIPATIPEELNSQIVERAKKVYEAIGTNGISRIDFLVDLKDNKIYAIEINTIPGSLSFYLWEAGGTQFHEALDIMIEDALNTYKENKKIIKSFDSPLWDE